MTYFLRLRRSAGGPGTLLLCRLSRRRDADGAKWLDWGGDLPCRDLSSLVFAAHRHSAILGRAQTAARCAVCARRGQRGGRGPAPRRALLPSVDKRDFQPLRLCNRALRLCLARVGARHPGLSWQLRASRECVYELGTSDLRALQLLSQCHSILRLVTRPMGTRRSKPNPSPVHIKFDSEFFECGLDRP
jgi:hypothetical protein